MWETQGNVRSAILTHWCPHSLSQDALKCYSVFVGVPCIQPSFCLSVRSSTLPFNHPPHLSNILPKPVGSGACRTIWPQTQNFPIRQFIFGTMRVELLVQMPFGAKSLVWCKSFSKNLIWLRTSAVSKQLMWANIEANIHTYKRVLVSVAY